MNKINMRQLAKELKVSVATVSKALNDSHEISEQTKRKVLEGASRLDYTINPYASSLRNKKSKTIAVILPEVADHFFSLAINGIQSVAEQSGYHVLIYLSHEKFSNEMAIIEDCKSGRVDGVLISVTSETSSADHFLKLRQENIPIVFFDRAFEGFPSSKVITNDFDCGNMAASHLLNNGCQKVAFLSVSSCLGICRKRAEGFKAAATALKMRTHSEVVILDAENNQELQDKIRKLLRSKNRPDGVVASVEHIATAVYLVCLELGIAIPGQLKVVAFSAIETASILNPSLTTISQPAFEIGRTAAELLFKQIKKKSTDSVEETITIPSTLIERSSSSALA